MQSAQRFSDLPEYAFTRLRGLLDAIPPGGPPLAMSIGEPTHPLPDLVAETIAVHAHGFALYPPNEGTLALRTACSDWLARRYGARLDPETQIVSLNGTREGLFNAALALSPDAARVSLRPAVLMPNPFYQCYGAAALAAGAEPVIVPATAETGFLPDFSLLPVDLLDRTSLCYICSPSNPQGAVADMAYWSALIGLAHKHDFTILADECYSEIYRDTPPPGALEAAAELGADPERVLAFHSLSKRSNAPGLRAGFAAGGARAIAALKQLRSYGGAPVPLPLQHAATALWGDEAHVTENRGLYHEKFALADRILGNTPGYVPPRAGFFLWLRTGDGEAMARHLWQSAGVRVLPGAYLGRATDLGPNPGSDYIRVALVAPQAQIASGLRIIADALAIAPGAAPLPA